MSKRKMALDYGEKRIGVAVSDPLGYTARGVCVVYRNPKAPENPIKKIKQLSEEYDVDTIIVGLPRRTDGKVGETAEKAIEFVDMLKKEIDINIIMRDERYTSVLAGRILKEKGNHSHRKTGEVDMMSAEILLYDYLRSSDK